MSTSGSSTPGRLNVNLASQAQDPPEVFGIRTQNRDFSTAPLNSNEASRLEEQFNVLVNDFDSRLASELFTAREQQIANAAAFAKNQFDEKLFGGINAADNEIAFDVLRPGHIRADPSDGSIQNNWFYEHTADGWSDWIGDGTSGNDYLVDEDQVVLVLGVMDKGALIIEEDTGTLNQFEREEYTPTSAVDVERFGRNVDMLPKDLSGARAGDNKNDELVQALPTVMGTDRDRIHMQLRSDLPTPLVNANAQVFTEPRLLGVTFGVGSYMNSQDFS